MALVAFTYGSASPLPIREVSADTIAAGSKALVAIICPASGNAPEAVGGTGFFIDSTGRFVTAGHVFTEASAMCTPVARFYANGWTNGKPRSGYSDLSMSKCSEYTPSDTEVCCAHPNPFLNKAFDGKIISLAFLSGQQQEGTPVDFTGFIFGWNVPTTAHAIVAAYHPDSNGSMRLFLDQAAWPGDSGGPIYDSDGHVIGLVDGNVGVPINASPSPDSPHSVATPPVSPMRLPYGYTIAIPSDVVSQSLAQWTNAYKSCDLTSE